MITLKKWNEMHAGSKITLPASVTLKSFNGEPREVKAGTYYINGFWGDMCGLSRKKKGSNDACIQSVELKAFNEVVN